MGDQPVLASVGQNPFIQSNGENHDRFMDLSEGTFDHADISCSFAENELHDMEAQVNEALNRMTNELETMEIEDKKTVPHTPFMTMQNSSPNTSTKNYVNKKSNSKPAMRRIQSIQTL